MRASFVMLGFALSGCSSILGIHALSDADINASDGKPNDGSIGDGSGSDGPNDGMTDSSTDGAATVQIGEFAQLGSSTTVNGNFIIARSFTVGGTTVIVAAGAYLKFETNNGHVKFALYNDNANSPFTRRALSGDITLDGTAGYNEIAIGPHTLAAGTYWMVMATDSSVDIGSVDTNNVLGAAASLQYSGAFPTTYNPQPSSSPTSDRINLYLQAQP